MPTPEEHERADGRRDAIVEAIRTSIRDRGYPPSVSELAETVDVSASQIKYDLGRLVRDGRIERDAGVTRGIRLLGDRPRPTRRTKATA